MAHCSAFRNQSAPRNFPILFGRAPGVETLGYCLRPAPRETNKALRAEVAEHLWLFEVLWGVTSFQVIFIPYSESGSVNRDELSGMTEGFYPTIPQRATFI